MGNPPAGPLVRAAADGDDTAFDALVNRFSGLVWSVVRAHRLSDAVAEDVFQTTWLRLVENLDRIREPDAVGGWLATVARNECLRVLRIAKRSVPVEDDQLEVIDADDDAATDLGLLVEERDRAVWAAFEELSERCRRLLRVLMADPPPTYEEVSAALDMPVGSIGPTRQRCLDKLRGPLRARGISVPSGASP